MRELAVLLTLVLGACGDNGASKESQQPKLVGRYQIVHSPHVQRDTILLDTVTGRTWHQITYTNEPNEPAGWEPLAREDYPLESKRVWEHRDSKQ